MIRNSTKRFSEADHASSGAGRRQSMQQILRKSIPFMVALLIGTLAGVLVAGVAMFAAHS
jgi:hypothetical protein